MDLLLMNFFYPYNIQTSDIVYFGKKEKVTKQ